MTFFIFVCPVESYTALCVREKYLAWLKLVFPEKMSEIFGRNNFMRWLNKVMFLPQIQFFFIDYFILDWTECSMFPCLYSKSEFLYIGAETKYICILIAFMSKRLNVEIPTLLYT